MLVTFKFKDNEILHCADLNDVKYRLENDDLAVYEKDKFLGYFERIEGIDVEEFLNRIRNEVRQ